MSKRSAKPQRARHVVLLDEDWEYLNKLYGPQSSNPIGVSEMIRTLVHRACERLREAEEGKVQAMRAAAAPQMGG
jgi:hypothetical protein